MSKNSENRLKYIKKFDEFEKKTIQNVKKAFEKQKKIVCPGWESNPCRLHAIPPQPSNAEVVSRAGDMGSIPSQGRKFFSVSEAFFTFFVFFFEFVQFFKVF